MGRRVAAAFVNFLMLAPLVYPTEYFTFDNFAPDIFSFSCLLLILLFCLYPESPGKRMLNLKILDEKNAEIGVKKRLLRAIPYLLFFCLSPVNRLLNASAVTVLIGIISLLALFFIFSNGLAVYFSPNSHSLLDMKLGTRVMTPRPVHGQERPTFMGVKLW
jgi:uncharacterized RDD family membrane protein YckC